MKVYVLRPSTRQLFAWLALVAALLAAQPAAGQDGSGIIELNKSAQPQQLLEPGGWVNFTFRVENTSPLTVTVEGLIDSVYGPLEQAGGNCSIPQTLSAGDVYTCTTRGEVAGGPGVHENSVTTWGTDWHKTTFAYTATATVLIVAEPPETGRGMPAAVVAGSTAAAGLGLLAAGAFVRRRTR